MRGSGVLPNFAEIRAKFAPSQIKMRPSLRMRSRIAVLVRSAYLSRRANVECSLEFS
jgi:hypothetical protein